HHRYPRTSIVSAASSGGRCVARCTRSTYGKNALNTTPGNATPPITIHRVARRSAAADGGSGGRCRRKIAYNKRTTTSANTAPPTGNRVQDGSGSRSAAGPFGAVTDWAVGAQPASAAADSTRPARRPGSTNAAER